MDDKQKSNNTLGQYNTEAFVPENKSTSENGKTSKGSTSMSGNDAKNSTSAGGNGSETRGEGREGASRVKDEYGEGLQPKAVSKASNEVIGSTERATGKKRGKVWPVVILVVLLASLGAVGWILLSGDRGDPGNEGNTGNIGAIDDERGEEKNELVELSLDNQLVKRLYGNFDMVGRPYTGTLDFYIDDGIAKGEIANKELVLAIALRAARNDGYCRGSGEYMNADQLYDFHTGCYSGDTIKTKVREIFGKEIEFVDGDWAGNASCSWRYSAKYDEFYNPAVGCGGACLYGITRELNKAERDENHIYLYETAYGGTCQSLCSVKGDVIAENKFDEKGNLISEFNFDDYRDQLERFKWTFTKNADGEYVFTGLEQIK